MTVSGADIKKGKNYEKRILIVEDDVTIQAQLKTLLTGNGYETAVVTDFSKTIEQVKP